MTEKKESIFKSKRTLFVCLGLAAACLIIYAQTFGFDFINIDDDLYVYQNPYVLRGLNAVNFKWAWTAFHASNWHPVTWLSLQFDALFFGASANGYHVVNVLFHIANSILLFVVVNKLTKAFWKSAIVAAIFAVHPAHVESVAWIAERKDVLSTLFWLLSTWAYLRYTDDTKQKNSLWLSIVFFALGLAAKPMLVTLPFTLILFDYWALERFEKWNLKNLLPLFIEKIPYFIITIISVVVTILAQKAGGALQTIEQVSIADRLLNSTVSYAKYVVMLVYPANLGVWYPFDANFSTLQIVGAIVLLAGITAISIWQIKQRKYLFVGWFWFLGTLVPVIGLLQVGGQSLADRYTYVPFIGLSIAVVWLFGEIFARLELHRNAVAAICAVALLALTVAAFRQTSFWQNSETMMRRTLAVTDKNYLVGNNYCDYLVNKNRLDEAVAQCEAAIAVNPNRAEAYNTLATARIKQNKLAEARTMLEKAVELNPDFVLAQANLSAVATNQGDFDQAGASLEAAIAADKNKDFFDTNRLADAYSSIAVAALKQKRNDQAEKFFRQAIEISPNNLDFRRNLAMALHGQGKSAEAVKILEEAIRQNPNFPEAYNTLGLIYAEQNRKSEAVAQFQKALQINPNFTPAQSNLKKLMQQ